MLTMEPQMPVRLLPATYQAKSFDLNHVGILIGGLESFTGFFGVDPAVDRSTAA
mgnify:CR=1 FL=1